MFGDVVMRRAWTQEKLALALSDGKPHSSKELTLSLKLNSDIVESGLGRMWRSFRVLRSAKPVVCSGQTFRGRFGMISNVRQYYNYLLCSEESSGVSDDNRVVSSVFLGGVEYVAYNRKYLDRRGGVGEVSKANCIRQFLFENRDRAHFSRGVVEALKDKEVIICDVMSTVRRLEAKGRVYVRGYRSHDKQTPFRDGFLLTWIDEYKPRVDALADAVRKTNVALENNDSTNPVIERIHVIHDAIVESTLLKDLVSFEFLYSKLGCSEYEAEGAIMRALKLYSDLREVKLFGAYKYYYHESMSAADLSVATVFKQNYVRQMKGRYNRLGHNWEACVEWFIDLYTSGAVFQRQKHRTEGMDPRRITLHLVKSVGSRRMNAEVDRVWSVSSNGLFSQPLTYVLECKWGLVKKYVIDDFLEVLKWSTEFGVDTTEGRQIKQGVVGVFAASAFDPQENVKLNDQTKISLAAYAARIKLELVSAADLNEKFRARGIPKEITVQEICRIAKDEKDVRDTLGLIWEKPASAKNITAQVIAKNRKVYEFEKALEEKPNPITVVQ
ncbi:MAG: hypothetical protein FWD52_08970 [Candidatus Bathyarchaeota archaeon]|nr:hypothetical protein [Candidatus Termiticorpusculum sp.]